MINDRDHDQNKKNAPIVVPIKLIKGDKHVWFIVFLNFEYGSKAAIFLFFHQNEKNTILGNFKAFRKNIGVIDCCINLFTQIY